MLNLIPKPLEVTLKEGFLLIDKNSKVEESDFFIKSVSYLKSFLNLNGENELISFVKDESFNDEEYVLDISDSIIVKASKDKGAYYAFVTLRQLIDADASLDSGIKVPKVYIHDKPEFSYRGFMLDTCRHFFKADDVIKYIDQMSRFKYNNFHFHISDDQGFRVDIKKYPKLKEISSKRAGTSVGNNFRGKTKSDNIPYEGIYTQKDIDKILDFCDSRFIKLTPEVDCPGHTTAINAAYPEHLCFPYDLKVREFWGISEDVMCIGNKDSLPFIADIILEVAKMFKSDTVHIGGDECPTTNYKKCPKCQAYMREHGIKNVKDLQGEFTIELSNYLINKGLKVRIWDEAISRRMDKSVSFNYWRGKKIKNNFDAIKDGYKVIATPFFRYYLDYIYPLFSLKDTYTFDPYYTKNIGKENKDKVLGVEAPLWCEHVKDLDKAFFQAFPRAIAISESGWTNKNNKDYNDFLVRLENYLPRLDKEGINYSPKACYTQKSGNLFKLVRYFFDKNDYCGDLEYKKYRG